ncbi:MAG: hypothetical protein DWH78_02340 [Planctomycetota bacterium]|nr:MAG: hypothetical protein DWH78_02340 [Planctomycetota bacterium]
MSSVLVSPACRAGLSPQGEPMREMQEKILAPTLADHLRALVATSREIPPGRRDLQLNRRPLKTWSAAQCSSLGSHI